MTHSKHNKASAAGPMFHVDGELSPTAESTNLAGHGIGRFRADPLGFMLRLTSESSAFYTGAVRWSCINMSDSWSLTILFRVGGHTIITLGVAYFTPNTPPKFAALC